MKLALKLALILISIICFRLFAGAEFLIGDHEIGSSWSMFIKHRPTWQFEFHNPAQHTLDIEPYDDLTIDEKAKLRDFCLIRFGLPDIDLCYAKMHEREI